MRLFGFDLKPGAWDDKSYSITIFRKGKCVGIFQFLWGYAKLFKFTRKNGRAIGMELLKTYYYWDEVSWKYSYPPGSNDAEIIEKALRYLRLSLFLDKILFRNR